MTIKDLIKISLLLYIGLLQAEGFIAGTLVHTNRGVIPVEQISVGDCIPMHGSRSIPVYPVTHVTYCNTDHYIKIRIGDDCICMALDQKIYVLDKQWIEARELNSLDRLVCINDLVVCVDSVETVYEQQKMYALSVETSHLFCVSSYGVIVHNIEPIMTGAAAATVALSIGCPPAGLAVMIGKCIALAVVGLGVYYAHKRSQINGKYEKDFAQDNSVNSCVGGGKDPNDNNDDDNDNIEDFWKNLKLRSDKNARSMRFGRLYRNPDTNLWWSQDLARHGGSFYKVFKETAKGFEWVYDAAKDGTRMLNKHKGPMGLFIPYKEVIFKI